MAFPWLATGLGECHPLRIPVNHTANHAACPQCTTQNVPISITKESFILNFNCLHVHVFNTCSVCVCVCVCMRTVHAVCVSLETGTSMLFVLIKACVVFLLWILSTRARWGYVEAVEESHAPPDETNHPAWTAQSTPRSSGSARTVSRLERESARTDHVWVSFRVRLPAWRHNRGLGVKW